MERRLAPVLAAIVCVLGGACSGAAASGAAGTTTTTITAPTSSADWPVYHHDVGGSGVAASIDLSPAHATWTSPSLDGDLFTEPLVVGSTVYVATENNTIYALNATDGSVIWSTHLAS